MSDLLSKKCVPCEGGTPPLTEEEVRRLLLQVPGWAAEGNKRIWREFGCRDFAAAVDLVNRIAEIAEEEQHHPDILIHRYKRVRVELSTHAIKGLSENDFIVAAKINSIAAV